MCRYEIRVQGGLTPTLVSAFEQLSCNATPAPAQTILHGEVLDDAALHGILRQIESLGLELVEVRTFDPHTPNPRNTHRRAT